MKTSLVLLVLMFSSLARAFTIAPRRSAVAARMRPFSGLTAAEDSSCTSIVDTCQAKIQTALEAESVKVTGAYDDPNGSHISIEVVSEKFDGKRPVQRQQMVYKAIWEELEEKVHAVDRMICKTPSEV